MSDEYDGYDAETLRGICRMYQSQNNELGKENLRLNNILNASLAEIVRLKKPDVRRKRGAPKKEAGTYETYLFRETIELVNGSIRNGNRISEKKACLLADKKIRSTAKILQDNGLPGSFHGLAPNYPADENSIYTAFRRAKRKLGFGRTKK